MRVTNLIIFRSFMLRNSSHDFLIQLEYANLIIQIQSNIQFDIVISSLLSAKPTYTHRQLVVHAYMQTHFS